MREEIKLRAVLDQDDCAACGACVSVCPQRGMHIFCGVYARNSKLCIGCGDCIKECPVGIIRLEKVGEQ